MKTVTANLVLATSDPEMPSKKEEKVLVKASGFCFKKSGHPSTVSLKRTSTSQVSGAGRCKGSGSDLSLASLEPGAESQIGANRPGRVLVLKLGNDIRHVVCHERLAL